GKEREGGGGEGEGGVGSAAVPVLALRVREANQGSPLVRILVPHRGRCARGGPGRIEAGGLRRASNRSGHRSEDHRAGGEDRYVPPAPVERRDRGRRGAAGVPVGWGIPAAPVGPLVGCRRAP